MRAASSFFGAAVLAASLVSPQADATEPAGKADIKPPLAKKDLDEEQLRLATLIHKKIVDYQEIKKKTDGGKERPFERYKETLNSGAQFEMAPIPGGSFTWKGEAKDDVLEVTLSPFWMGVKEVTWDQFDPYMYSPIARQKDGSFPDFIAEQTENDLDFLARPTPPYHPMTFGMPRDGHPAVAMTQHGANKYCQWISFQTGHFYRLPTEAEWEYACLAGTKGDYSWGDAAAEDYAWFGGDSSSHYTKPGSKKPNPWGLYDMHGNVAEWTLDQYVPNRNEYFGKSQVTNPWVKATELYPQVVKGGHWKQSLEDLKVSSSLRSEWAWKKEDPQVPQSLWFFTNPSWLGMRLVRPKEIPTAEEMYHYWNSGVEGDDEEFRPAN